MRRRKLVGHRRHRRLRAGGDGPFFAQANAVCREAQKTGSVLPQPHNETELAPFLERAQMLGQDEVNKLSALHPPSDRAAAYRIWLGSLNQTLGELRAAVSRGEGSQDRRSGCARARRRRPDPAGSHTRSGSRSHGLCQGRLRRGPAPQAPPRANHGPLRPAHRTPTDSRGPRILRSPLVLWRGFKRLTRLGWPRRFAIVQFPNAPLIIAFLAGEVAKHTHGLGHAYASSAATWRSACGHISSWWTGPTGSGACLASCSSPSRPCTSRTRCTASCRW